LFSFEKVKFLQSYMVLLYPTKVYPQVTTSRMNNMNVSILQNILVYKKWGVTWRVSDCEELVGVTHRRWWGWF